MIWFKACPKCRGDIYLAEDIYGKYLKCLQCGYAQDVDTSGKSLVPVNTENETRVRADPVTHAFNLQTTRRERGTASKNT